MSGAHTHTHTHTHTHDYTPVEASPVRRRKIVLNIVENKRGRLTTLMN